MLAAWRKARTRNVGPWLWRYLLEWPRRRAPRKEEPIHVLICIGDHYEPKLGRLEPEVAAARVRRWVEDYPKTLGEFRDSDGRPPRHTFFFPPEEYEPEYL